jgi:monofunctional biosynthetic peptidoglycan transglycosylase
MAKTRRKKKATTRISSLATAVGRVRRAVLRTVLLLAVLAMLWVAAYSVVPVPTTPYILSERLRLGSVERDWTPIADISDHLQHAAVAAEDANFCLHWGFDMDAIRAALDDGRARGGLDHQPADGEERLSLAGRSAGCARRWRRGLTPVVEAVWSKRRILEVYLNVAEFDEGVFGVEAAAQHYFGVSAADLTRRRRRGWPRCCPNRPSGARPASRLDSCAGAAASILDGAATIAADGRAACFES